MRTSDSARSETVRVTDILRDEIIDGVRKPGSRLVERDLARELGVSRVPIREALKQLAGEGLVSPRPNTWSTVREFTASDIADLNEVLGAFEVMTFELAAQRHTREGLADLEAAVARGREFAARGDAIGARRAAADFHEIVTELAGNVLLVEIGGLLSSRKRWLLSQHDDLAHVAEEHAGLCEAIARRDVSGISALVLDHLESSQRRHIAHSEKSLREAEQSAPNSDHDLSRSPS
ncbi:GntR family transcriptional regulator [Brevibacterium sanguinis]|uniref:GntR family transcriptional regulator n=2 Tax=Brevibacterium TaxID=1696 RepID=A0A366ILK1_9MICO|nr:MULTISPECIES: GntR family transcriptional regulator [Brevibacterium]RBP66110.1 GntR family transcriptional regulator [Brevibacterium sanguinis]RBP72761.1 GntR family transcriptional regulator [Brevibacterium celere]